jgi:ABC-type nitrate/sulfonate/bicarbonate transport system ATPase subunit
MGKQLFMLSTGSKRKVWLTAAFASGAALLLLDEPFAALDAPSIAFVKEQLQGISAHAGRAAVIADYAAPGGVLLAGVIDSGRLNASPATSEQKPAAARQIRQRP